MANTIAEIVAAHRGAHAIGAPGRPWLDGAALADLAQTVRTELREAGIGRNDRVAIVLPNGPEMATCFLAVASGCAAAPLNPAYKEEELDFYLSDLKPRALILGDEDEGPASFVAARLRIPVITLSQTEGAAGSFRLNSAALRRGRPAHPGPAEAGDIALVLHTSGTTARPKIVPLTNGNLAASAGHIAAALALTPSDVCMNIMPLFHIHGLVAAVLASMRAGGGVSCTPGFSAFKVAEWLRAVKPTWFTAVPTMHQAILMRMRDKPEARAAGLRFIRSSSASLPPRSWRSWRRRSARR